MADPAVRVFFASVLGDPEPDDAVISYLAECLANPADEEEGVLDTVATVLCSLSNSFAQLPDEDKGPIIVQLYEQVQASLAAEEQAQQQQPQQQQPTLMQRNKCATISQPDLAASVLCSLPSTVLAAATNASTTASECGQGAAAPARQAGPSQGVSSSSSSAALGPQPGSHVRDADVDALADMLGGSSCNLSREYLSHVLGEHGGLQGAVEWVLEEGEELGAREAAWRARAAADAARTAAEARDEARLKQQLLARFDLRKVPDAPAKPKQEHDALMRGVLSATQPAISKVRYRDGQVVSMKGDKYILEKTKDDWDGGSKGKVYTKGKRGKGFL